MSLSGQKRVRGTYLDIISLVVIAALSEESVRYGLPNVQAVKNRVCILWQEEVEKGATIKNHNVLCSDSL